MTQQTIIPVGSHLQASGDVTIAAGEVVTIGVYSETGAEMLSNSAAFDVHMRTPGADTFIGRMIGERVQQVAGPATVRVRRNTYMGDAFGVFLNGDATVGEMPPPFVPPVWSPVNKPTGLEVVTPDAVIHGNGVLFATNWLGNAGQVPTYPQDKWYSLDNGDTWTPCTQTARATIYPPSVVFHKGSFYSWAYDNPADYLRNLSVSSDGITFTDHPTPPNTFDGEVGYYPVSNGTVIVTVGVDENSDYNTLYRSSDGITWEGGFALPVQAGFSQFGNISWSGHAQKWVAAFTQLDADWNMLFPDKLFTSPDGLNWEEVSRAGMPEDMVCMKGFWGCQLAPEGMPIVVSSDFLDSTYAETEKLFASYDLINWTKVWDGGDIAGVRFVVQFEGGVIAYGNGRCLISPDGFNWELSTSPTSADGYGASIGKRIVAPRRETTNPGFHITDIEVS